jgi:Bacterial protein of unknown function (DUF937)
MATNLVSQIMSYLTPDMVAKIASYCGLDRSTSQVALSAAVPSLLASLVGLSSKPEGASQLARALGEQPSGFVDSYRSLTGGADTSSFVDKGSSMLSSLFGGSMFNGIAGAIGKYAGIGEGTGKSMLGLLGPLVLGGLAQQQRQTGLDANGLSSFLASQKENIAAAMPSGLSSMLSGALGDTWRSGTSAASEAARSGAASASAAAQRFAASATETTAPPRDASSNWLPWALGLLALAGLAWWLIGQTGDRVAQKSPASITETGQTFVVGGVNVAAQVSAAINGMRSAVQGITDTISAQAAVPRLRQAAADLDSASGLANRLPASGRNALASRVAAEVQPLDREFNTALARPEIAAVLGPEIDNVRMKLNALSRG